MPPFTSHALSFSSKECLPSKSFQYHCSLSQSPFSVIMFYASIPVIVSSLVLIMLHLSMSLLFLFFFFASLILLTCDGNRVIDCCIPCSEVSPKSSSYSVCLSFCFPFFCDLLLIMIFLLFICNEKSIRLKRMDDSRQEINC